LPAVVEPGLVADLARLRDRVELPQLLTGARVVGTAVAGRAARHFRCAGTDQHDVAENGRRIAVGRALDLDRAALPEGLVLPAGRGIERGDRVAGVVEQARAVLPVARPPGDAAPNEAALDRMIP